MINGTRAAFTYQEYIRLVEALVQQKSTTGMDKTTEKISVTRLNLHRMKRIESRTSLLPGLKKEIQNIKGRLKWVVLTEAWCGDASQTVPVLSRIAEESNGKITMELRLRDEHPELMEQFLTGGTRSIPKLICYAGDSGRLLGSWGPRPKKIQEEINQFKLERAGYSHAELLYALHTLYAVDKAVSLQEELIPLLYEWAEAERHDHGHLMVGVMLPAII